MVSGTLGAAYAESVKDKYGLSIATFSDSHSMYAAVLKGRAAACFEDTPALRDSIAGGVALELVPGSEGAASDYCVAICDEKDRPFLSCSTRAWPTSAPTASMMPSSRSMRIPYKKPMVYFVQFASCISPLDFVY